MNPLIEKEIQQLLSKGEKPTAIAKTLLKKKNLSQDTDAFLAVCRFMYQSGLYQMLIKTAITRLKKGKTIPWSLIIEVLESQKIDISKDKRDFFIEGILAQKQIRAMLTSHQWDKYYPELVNMRSEEIKQINEDNNYLYIKLMEDLQFIQSQGVLKKEGEILKKLKEVDPDNPEIQEKWLQFREKWGRNIIHQKKINLLNKSDFSISTSKEEKKQAEKIAWSIKEILNKNSKSSYDMALFFSFIGYPYLAIQILKDHLDSMASQWLYLDLLLQSELYLDCLNFVDVMEEQYSEDPETVFALMYVRAKAYYGLGKKEKAKSILSDLLAVRPNYRLTHLLLKQWEAEVSE